MNIFTFSVIIFAIITFIGMRIWNARGNMHDALGAVGILAAGLLGLCLTGIAWAIWMILP
jgi:hypothetical protein